MHATMQDDKQKRTYVYHMFHIFYVHTDVRKHMHATMHDDVQTRKDVLIYLCICYVDICKRYGHMFCDTKKMLAD